MYTARWNLDRSDPTQITKRFADIGAKAEVTLKPALHNDVRLDIRATNASEVFEIQMGVRAALHVIDVDRSLRQVLLGSGGSWRVGTPAQHFLCGRDEQHWFVASVPNTRGPVTTVAKAFEALKPEQVLEAQERAGLSEAQKMQRSNDAYTRQGEWFFVPRPRMFVPHHQVRRNEPVQRVRGKPHWLEFAFRTGGRTVWVCAKHSEGLEQAEYAKVLKRDPKAAQYEWRQMRADPKLYAKGRVTHPDHKPAYLRCWHEVFISTEHQAANGSVTFLD